MKEEKKRRKKKLTVLGESGKEVNRLLYRSENEKFFSEAFIALSTL